jgi:thiamine biosynthesis protein ThiS
MQIFVNGEAREIETGATLADLLAELGVQSRHVAVEANMQLVPRAVHSERHLADGDRLEIVALVGGG